MLPSPSFLWKWFNLAPPFFLLLERLFASSMRGRNIYAPSTLSEQRTKENDQKRASDKEKARKMNSEKSGGSTKLANVVVFFVRKKVPSFVDVEKKECSSVAFRGLQNIVHISQKTQNDKKCSSSGTRPGRMRSFPNA